PFRLQPSSRTTAATRRSPGVRKRLGSDAGRSGETLARQDCAEPSPAGKARERRAGAEPAAAGLAVSEGRLRLQRPAQRCRATCPARPVLLLRVDGTPPAVGVAAEALRGSRASHRQER